MAFFSQVASAVASYNKKTKRFDPEIEGGDGVWVDDEARIMVLADGATSAQGRGSVAIARYLHYRRQKLSSEQAIQSMMSEQTFYPSTMVIAERVGDRRWQVLNLGDSGAILINADGAERLTAEQNFGKTIESELLQCGLTERYYGVKDLSLLSKTLRRAPKAALVSMSKKISKQYLKGASLRHLFSPKGIVYVLTKLVYIKPHEQSERAQKLLEKCTQDLPRLGFSPYLLALVILKAPQYLTVSLSRFDWGVVAPILQQPWQPYDGAEASKFSIELKTDDALLLASDGLLDNLSLSDIYKAVRQQRNAKVASAELLRAAKLAIRDDGKGDDVSVALFRCGELKGRRYSKRYGRKGL